MVGRWEVFDLGEGNHERCRGDEGGFDSYGRIEGGVGVGGSFWG